MIRLKPDLHIRQSMVQPHFWIFTRSMAIIWDVGNTIYAIFAYIPFTFSQNMADIFCLVEQIYAAYIFYCSIWIFRALKQLCMRNPWSPSMLSINPDWNNRNQHLFDGETSINTKKSNSFKTSIQPDNFHYNKVTYSHKKLRIPNIETTKGYFSEYESQDEEVSAYSTAFINNQSPNIISQSKLHKSIIPVKKKYGSEDNIDPEQLSKHFKESNFNKEFNLKKKKLSMNVNANCDNENNSPQNTDTISWHVEKLNDTNSKE